jgi:VanZ family protein
VILKPWTWRADVKGGAFGLANAILLYLCLAPQQDLPGVSLWDKAEHGLAWTVLTTVALLLWPSRSWRIALGALALGGIVEVLQAALPFGRDGEVSDWIADAVGVALALAGHRLVRVAARRR